MSKKYFRHINTLFVVIPMSLIMAIVGTTKHHGLCEDLMFKILASWIVMFPMAFISAFVIIPPARKLAEKVAVK